eukprot:COSAG06_NODE_30073_length_545_cov_0.910314_1_plen_107_part_10
MGNPLSKPCYFSGNYDMTRKSCVREFRLTQGEPLSSTQRSAADNPYYVSSVEPLSSNVAELSGVAQALGPAEHFGQVRMGVPHLPKMFRSASSAGCMAAWCAGPRSL